MRSASWTSDPSTWVVPFYVTLGGVSVGAAITLAMIIRWWFAEKHRLGAIVPFIVSMAYGMLAVLSGGGVLGAAGLITLWAGNGIGYAGLVWGVGGTDMGVTHRRQLVLDPGGHVIVLLLTVVLVSLWLWAKKIRNWKLALGAVAGVMLGLSGTIAGAAAVPLATGANFLGLPFTEML